MKLSEFNFKLPANRTAVRPTRDRDQSKLMVINKNTAKISHKKFSDIVGFFEKDDVLLNYPRPKGWSYSSRIINEDLILNSKGIVDVLAIRSDPSSVWEKR